MPGAPYTRQNSALNLIPIKFLKIPNTKFILALVSRFEHTRLVLVHNSSCVQNLELVTWVQIQRFVFWKIGNFDVEIDVQSGWLMLFETTPLSDCQGGDVKVHSKHSFHAMDFVKTQWLLTLWPASMWCLILSLAFVELFNLTYHILVACCFKDNIFWNLDTISFLKSYPWMEMY